MQKGPYKFEPESSKDDVKRVMKDMVKLENGEQYFGFWYDPFNLIEGMRRLMNGTGKEC